MIEHIMARTLWGEARGEGVAGMTAVACVIMNRARHPRWWGNTPDSVCTKPYQFSCWLPDDPNRAKLLAVTDTDAQFAEALDITARAIDGLVADVTGNADSYYALGTPQPVWAATAIHTATIGGQAFFRTELPPPAPQPVIAQNPTAIASDAPIPIPVG